MTAQESLQDRIFAARLARVNAQHQHWSTLADRDVAPGNAEQERLRAFYTQEAQKAESKIQRLQRKHEQQEQEETWQTSKQKLERGEKQ